MDHIEAQIRSKCQIGKDEVMGEIRSGRWRQIDFAQVCRNFDAQMHYELRVARERYVEGLTSKRGRPQRIYEKTQDANEIGSVRQGLFLSSGMCKRETGLI